MGIPPAIGPYRVLDLLGRGGMGAVYRAEHEATGAAVALKVVSAPSGAGIAAIRREIHALGRVTHPGVVRIVDQGAVDGLPWYAMEIVHGRTLRALLDEGVALEQAATVAERAALEHAATIANGNPGAEVARSTTVRTPTTRAVDVCVDLCEPLAVIHAAGLVHRDLKPDNVLVSSNGRPVLVDFGIAGGFGGVAGREELAAAGEVIGTLAYMAPEQIRGDLVDARADLYALGCILYECLTGVTPFAAHGGYAILRAHLLEAPIAPSQRGVDVSPELDALVLRLLAKRPADRVGHVTDVAAMLRDMGHGRHSVPSVNPPPYLYRADLAGRREVMTRAMAQLDGLARTRRGGVVYAGGESGVGKTRVGVEITREATVREIKVVTGHCLLAERAGSTPLHPFLALLQEALGRVLDGAFPSLAPHARVLALYCPELAASFARFPEPPPLAPDAARARVLDAAVAAIRALSESQPLLLVLDDVHWADELSLALLGRLGTAGLETRGLLCICLYRSEDATDALLALLGAPGVESWTLGRLDESSVAEMAAGMLATPRVPRAWAELLARVSGGNPFFAGEYLRAAVEAGILTRDARGRWLLKAADAARGESLSLPSTIEALLEARFSRLNGAELRLLAAAAVLGRTLEGDVASVAAGLEDRAALDALSGLAQRQILEEAADGQLRFVHDRLREAAYARLGADDRRQLHGNAAAAIEARYQQDPSQFVRLANHHASADRHDAAYWYASVAADQAAAVYANEQAIALHRAALAAAETGGAAPERHEESWSRLGDLLHHGGQAKEAHDAYSNALTHVSPNAPTRRAELLLALGSSLGTLQRHADALAVFAQAAEHLGATPPGADPSSWWRARIQIGIERIMIHYYAANTPAMALVIEELEPLVEVHGSEAQRARFFQSLVLRDLRGARYRTSAVTVGYARRCLEGFAAGNDRAMQTDARFSLATVQLWNDALDDAAEELLAVLDETEAIGNAVTRVACLAYLTVVSRRQRDVDETRIMAFRCLSAAEEAKLSHYAGVAEANLGWVHLENESPDEAEALCHSALARWRALPLAYPFQWLARLPLMKLAFTTGKLDEAHEHARAVLELTQQRLPDALEEVLTHGELGAGLRVAQRYGFL